MEITVGYITEVNNAEPCDQAVLNEEHILTLPCNMTHLEGNIDSIVILFSKF